MMCLVKIRSLMMKMQDNFFTYMDIVYPHGTEECVAGKCQICVAGEWKERIELCAFANINAVESKE
jgi:hypothetical protein